MSARDQLADGRDGQPRLLATLADGADGACFAGQTASAREFGSAGERLVGPPRPDEILSRVLDDCDRHALSLLAPPSPPRRSSVCVTACRASQPAEHP